MGRSFTLVAAVAFLAGTSLLATADSVAQDEAPKPSVTVVGTAAYLGKGRDSIVVTLTKLEEPKPAGRAAAAQDPKPEEAKPATSTTNAKGEFEFKGVAVGKYRLTAAGRPANSLRAYKEADPVDLAVTADTTSPVTKTIALTLDKAR